MPLPPDDELHSFGLCRRLELQVQNQQLMQHKRYILDLERRMETLEIELSREKYRADTLERIFSAREERKPSPTWLPAYGMKVRVVGMAGDGQEGDDSVFETQPLQSDGFVPLRTSTPNSFLQREGMLFSAYIR